MAEIAILDVDGIPANTDYPHTEAWTRALEEVGKRVPRVDAYRRIGEGADRLIPEFVGEEAAGKVDRRHAVLSGGAFGRDELEGSGATSVYRDCAGLLEAGFPENIPAKE